MAYPRVSLSFRTTSFTIPLFIYHPPHPLLPPSPPLLSTLAVANLTSSVVMLMTVVSLDARVAGMRRSSVTPWIIVHTVLGGLFLLV